MESNDFKIIDLGHFVPGDKVSTCFNVFDYCKVKVVIENCPVYSRDFDEVDVLPF